MYIEQHDYDIEIERIAKEAIAAEREYGQNARDAAWEIVDGHRWVIYTVHAARIPALAYSFGGEYLDGVDLNAQYREGGLPAVLTMAAFACMLEDVLGKIEDLRATEDEEEDEEDEEK